MIKVSSLNVSLVISLVVIILLFVYIYNKYQTKENYARIERGPTDIPANAQIQVKYVIEDDKDGVFSTKDRAPDGGAKEVDDYIIYTGTVNANANDITWTKMQSYTKNGNLTHEWVPDNGNDVWKAAWFGSGNIPPTKPVRFPTLAEMRSGSQPIRRWPSGETVIENHGMDDDKCMGVLNMVKPGTGAWYCPAELKFTIGSGYTWKQGF